MSPRCAGAPLLLLVLSACQAGRDARDPAPGQTCLSLLEARGIAYDPVLDTRMEHPTGHPEIDCAIPEQILLRPVLHQVFFRLSGDPAPRHFRTSCAMALRLDEMAALLARQGILEVVHAGSYNCRAVAETSALSLHATAMAFDVLGVMTRSGEGYSVLRDWSGSSEGSLWLHRFAEQLYEERLFNVVLTPEQDAAHRSHLHLDLTPGAHYLSRKRGWVLPLFASAGALALLAMIALLRKKRRAGAK